ncbi:DNA polymerase V [Chitinophaga polysaccharea]|uniref:DNA polymerase V n=1 Tax=Chitinophaga polysaccharea TaxID=1293035 RepID=A0A561P0X7_9BACT|nr:Y-family DNA polymerase [Chitinophaga polysaccharea]TWF31714.1 DNA polymerase V [Chitinophaga polysaccharea]
MYALVDCNNFYASCQRVFEPRIRRLPVVVLSNNDGCIIARSNEAKDLGIKMGDLPFKMLDFLTANNVQIFSSNYTLYGDMSARVMQVIAAAAPKYEVYSIDEAFIDLQGVAINELEAFAKRLKRNILQATGLPVSVGIAPTKTLAKLANRWAKKHPETDGIHVLGTDQKVSVALQQTMVGDVWGIGRQYEQMLNRHNITTALQLSLTSESWIRKSMSVVGLRLVKELKGQSCILLEEMQPPKQNICTSRSFPEIITEKEDVRKWVMTHMASCAEKLRRQNSCASAIHVFLQTNPFRMQDKQYYRSITIPLLTPANNTPELLFYAGKALNAIYRPGYNYKKAGAMVLDLVPACERQGSLFDSVDRLRAEKLMNCIDSTNAIFGRNIVRYASQGYGERWQLRQARKSPSYTTRWQDVIKIQI